VNVAESSLSYRAIRWASAWLAVSVRSSYVGRGLLYLTGAPREAFASSELFGLRRSGSRSLERTGHPVSVLLISRPYWWLRESLGARVGSVHAECESFAGGNWLKVLGAGVFGLGVGRILWLAVERAPTDEGGATLVASSLLFVSAALLVVVGLLLCAAGPAAVPALRTSLLARGIRWVGNGVVEGRPGSREGVSRRDTPESAESSPLRSPKMPASRAKPLWRRVVDPVVLAAMLAVVAGLVGGFTSDSGWLVLVAFTAAVSLLALSLRRPEVMLVLVALFPWLDWMARNSLGGLGPLWDDALLLLSAALLVWGVVVLRRSRLWTVPIALPALLAFTAALGSVVINQVPDDVALFALRVLFQPLLFYFLGFLFPKNKRLVRWVVAVFLLAGLALALHGLYQYATNAPMPARWVDLREVGVISTRAYSIIGNPNGLGAFLLLGSLLSLSLALARQLGRAQRVAMAIICVVQLGGIAVTFSRGAWLGLGAGLLALIILAHRRYLAPLVAAGVLAWFVVPRQFVDRLTFAFSSAYIAKSLTAGRLYVWKMALGYIAAHPFFGVGLGTFGGTSAVLFSYGRLWVDNFYLQLAAEGGLILLALFLWVLLRGAKGLLKGHGATRDPFLRALTAGVFAGWVAVAVANVTASVWETLVVGVGFWFLGGLSTSAALHLVEAGAGEHGGEPSAAAGAEGNGSSTTTGRSN
jgi:O-antigen ligase